MEVMPRFDTGKVVRIVSEREGVARLIVEVGGVERRATAFTDITGAVSRGDRVVVNTTGVDLELGTGGEDFVLWNLEREEFDRPGGGHILKMRYTPFQIDVLASESPESPHHGAFIEAESVEGAPVVACGLHSQIAAVAAVIKTRRPAARVAYVMTDGAALPIVHSDLVARLIDLRLVDATITCGHSFGGDLEAVNVFSGLVAARRAASCDALIVGVGPGIVGTGTALGHTGLDQGIALTAAAALGGLPIAALRVSFSDPRVRHRVVSHHTLSALRLAASPGAVVAVPRLDEQKLSQIQVVLEDAGIDRRHVISIVDPSGAVDAMKKLGLEVSTMGRSMEEDPEFFEAAGAAGALAAEALGGI